MYRNNNKFSNKKKTIRNPKRFYTKSPHGEGEGSLPYLDEHNNKSLELLNIGEVYEFCQHKESQVKFDYRYHQKRDRTRIEWFHGIKKNKYFIITDIKEGFILGIHSKFNGHILTLMRVK